MVYKFKIFSSRTHSDHQKVLFGRPSFKCTKVSYVNHSKTEDMSAYQWAWVSGTSENIRPEALANI